MFYLLSEQIGQQSFVVKSGTASLVARQPVLSARRPVEPPPTRAAMCLPPKSPEAVAEPKAAAKAQLYTPRWPAASTASFPVDKRINVMFEGVPGVQLSPLYLLELPLAIFLGW